MKAVVIYRRNVVDMLLGEQEAQIVEIPYGLKYKDTSVIPKLLRSEPYQQNIRHDNIDQVIWLDEGVVNESYEG